MRSSSILVGLLACTGSGAQLSNEKPGIGITLASGYGTISAYYANGTYVDIAKIEGGEKYKAYMLAEVEGGNDRHAPMKPCSMPSWLCKYWPTPGMGLENPLAPMLRALLSAAECALETKLESAAFSMFDFHGATASVARDHVHLLANYHGLDDRGRLDNMIRQIAGAVGLYSNCSGPYTRPTDPEFYAEPIKLVMTVQYDRQAIVTGLWEEDCGQLNQLRWNSSHSAGYDSVQRCLDSSADSKECFRVLESAIGSVLESSRTVVEAKQTIGAVLVMGEKADDKLLNERLRGVLTNNFVNGASVALRKVQEYSPEPAFVGSRAAAWLERGAQDLEQFEGRGSHAVDL